MGLPSLEPRLSVPDFVSQLWRKIVFVASNPGSPFRILSQLWRKIRLGGGACDGGKEGKRDERKEGGLRLNLYSHCPVVF